MADFDIDLHFLFEAESFEEAIDGGDIVVVLVLGRFLRLGSMSSPLKPIFLACSTTSVRKRPAWCSLALEIGIEQRFI